MSGSWGGPAAAFLRHLQTCQAGRDLPAFVHKMHRRGCKDDSTFGLKGNIYILDPSYNLLSYTYIQSKVKHSSQHRQKSLEFLQEDFQTKSWTERTKCWGIFFEKKDFQFLQRRSDTYSLWILSTPSHSAVVCFACTIYVYSLLPLSFQHSSQPSAGVSPHLSLVLLKFSSH